MQPIITRAGREGGSALESKADEVTLPPSGVADGSFASKASRSPSTINTTTSTTNATTIASNTTSSTTSITTTATTPTTTITPTNIPTDTPSYPHRDMKETDLHSGFWISVTQIWDKCHVCTLDSRVQMHNSNFATVTHNTSRKRRIGFKDISTPALKLRPSLRQKCLSKTFSWRVTDKFAKSKTYEDNHTSSTNSEMWQRGKSQTFSRPRQISESKTFREYRP
ncbi:integumentary mucin C.1-like [Penaeus indicus]|uniref:integumentary mucin C.1-like n=1 Tax=Penaeus indicus TaxID=29960 RepID=UPI00300D0DAA